MVSFTFKAILALQAATAATARIQYPSSLADLADEHHRQLPGGCHTCDCFTCDSVTEDGDDLLVKVGHCKDGSISWMCCVGLDGERDGCELEGCSGSQEGSKCNTVTADAGLQIRIPKTTKTFEVNTHDGKTSGDSDMYNAVCGGKGNQGGSCKAKGTAHCLIEFDLATDCGYVPEPEAEPRVPEPEPEVPEPEPEPEVTAPEPEPEPEVVEPEPEPEENPPAPDPLTPADKESNTAFTKGDPHFKTFGGEMYDYHGECDLVLLHNPDFRQGLGMDIHIRTKIEAFWSSVEASVIKLGDDTLEIRADPTSANWIWFNGEVPTHDVVEGEWHRHEVAGFMVRYKENGPNTREALVYLKGSQEVINMKTFKSFVRVDVNWQGSDDYTNSIGLLGSHANNGERLGRDGKFIKNVNAFGQEWQVRPEVDGSLFHSYEGAVVGKKCVLPPHYEGGALEASALRGRRLGASALDTDLVEKACNHLVDPEEKKACEFDVIATQDLNMASAW